MKRYNVAGLVVAASMVVLTVFSSACGDDDVVAYSETVSIKLSGIKEGDITNGSASVDKNVNTEEGNPYGDFLKTAKERLGRDPSDVEVVSVVVKVHPDSNDVTMLDQVFTDLEVFLSTSETVINIGELGTVAGTSMNVPVFDEIDYEPVRVRMLDGNFKMGVRGATIDSLPGKFELKLTLDVKFRAIE